MNNLRDIKTIEAYLEGNMTEEEMEDVEIRILLDQQFRQEFDSTRILIRGIKESARQTTLKEKIQQLEKVSPPQPELESAISNDQRSKIIPIKRYRIPILSAGIAAIILLLVVIFFHIFSSSHLSPEQLFAQNFEVSPNMGIQDTRGETSVDPAAPAYRAYDNKNFILASNLFESIVDQSDQRLTDLFHLANCYLVLEKWNEAIKALDEVARSNSPLSENAKWYLALAYVRTGEYQKAKSLLNEIATPKTRVKEARRIIKKLN